jgi:hypothetical protein
MPAKGVAVRERLNVCLFVNRLVTGGAERQIIELARGLDKARFNTYVLTLRRGGELEWQLTDDPGVQLVCLDRRGRFDVTFLPRLLRFLRRERVHVLQPFLTPATLFGYIAGILARTPILITTERGGAVVDPGSLGYRAYNWLEGTV